VILIMTTNAGAQDMAKEAFGFHRSKREGDDTEAINRLFSPEFRNRLDAVVPFSRLPQDVIARVVDKFILQLEAQLADRNVTIELSDEARAWLVTNGYDEAMGARPMARVIQTQIKTPLADEVLFGRLKNGGVVRVVVTGDDTGVKKLGFVYPEGPAQPRLERDLLVAGRERAKEDPEARKLKGRKRDATADPEEDDGEKSPTEPQAT
jgi:ATP-dependent Clp protease ATP-binding subunit ClpA